MCQISLHAGLFGTLEYLHKVPYFSNELAMDRAYIFWAQSNLMLIENYGGYKMVTGSQVVTR